MHPLRTNWAQHSLEKDFFLFFVMMIIIITEQADFFPVARFKFMTRLS